MKSVPVFIVSMDKDADRFETVKGLLEREGFHDVSRIRGVPGGALCEVVCSMLTRTPKYLVGKGALGCFLSHAAAWERAATPEAEWSLILEDDVILQNFALLHNADLPRDADFIFCNDYMEPEKADGAVQKPELQFLPVGLALKKMERRRYNGIGTQGYLLSRAGAAKLLNAVLADGFFGHIDWRLMRYSVTKQLLDDVIPNTRVANILREHHNKAHPPAWGVLSTRCACPALVVHKHVSSNRKIEDHVH